jgi:hypothetical protein
MTILKAGDDEKWRELWVHTSKCFKRFENCLAIFITTEHTSLLWASNSTLRMEHLCLLCKKAHKLKAVQNQQRWIRLCAQSERLHIGKKWNSCYIQTTRTNFIGAKLTKEVTTKEHMLCDSTYLKHKRRQNLSMSIASELWLPLGEKQNSQ